MALVRRASVMGPSAGVYVGHAAVPAVPAQSGPAHSGPVQSGPAGHGQPGQPGQHGQLVQPGQPGQYGHPAAPPAGPELAAAAVPSRPASPLSIVLSFGFVTLGTLISWVLWKSGRTAAPFQIGNQTAAYAGVTAF